MRLRFSTKLIAMTTFLVVLSVAISTITAYYYKRKSLEQALANELLGIVNSVSTFVDGEQHNLIAFDPILGEMDNEAYLLKLHEQLQRVENNNPKIINPGHSAIYTLRPVEDIQGVPHMEFVASSRRNRDNTFDTGKIIRAEDFQLNALQGKSVTRGLYEDEHGVWISACAPIMVKISDGNTPTLRVGGLVQADYNVESFFREVRNQTSTLLGGAIVGIILASILSYWFERKLTRPIKQLSAATGKIAKGDLEVSVDIGTQDELVSWARPSTRWSRACASATW